MHPCKSGKHYWTDKADADKCCNGYKRILVIGRIVAGVTNIVYDPEVGVSYGRQWVKDEERKDSEK